MTPKAIVCHVTASAFGDRATVKGWHLERGFSDIGYHRLIGNGWRTSQGGYDSTLDGFVWQGREDHVEGAHCKAGGMNNISLGVSCVGNPGFLPAGADPNLFLEAAPQGRACVRQYLTRKQYLALINTLAALCKRYGIDPEGQITYQGKQIYTLSQHSDHDPAKPLCASLNMAVIRKQVAQRLAK